jgi:hypothetical protein
MLYTHPPLGVRNYATPATPALLDAFDSQVENYSTEYYQTPQVEKFCTDFLRDQGFPLMLSFDPHNNDNYNELEHIKAYKCLRQGLRVFEINRGHLERLEKPLGSRDWILAQQIRKDQERMEEEGRREELLVSEVETDEEKEGSKDKEDTDDENDDDRLFLDLNISL